MKMRFEFQISRVSINVPNILSVSAPNDIKLNIPNLVS